MDMVCRRLLIPVTAGLLTLTAGPSIAEAQLGSLDTHMLSVFQGRSRVMFEQKWMGSGRMGAAAKPSPTELRGRKVIAAGQATTSVDETSPNSPVPAQMAQAATRDATARRSYTKTYSEWLQFYPKFASKHGFDPNDLSDTTTAFVMTCYSVHAGQNTTDRQDEGVRKALRAAMLKDPKVQGATRAERQEARDALAIMTVAAVKGMQSTPEDQAKTRQVAAQMFTSFIGQPPSRYQTTADGLRLR